jgi:hypothetical protein
LISAYRYRRNGLLGRLKAGFFARWRYPAVSFGEDQLNVGLNTRPPTFTRHSKCAAQLSRIKQQPISKCLSQFIRPDFSLLIARYNN